MSVEQAPMEAVKTQVENVTNTVRDTFANLSSKASSTFGGFKLMTFFKVLLIIVAVVGIYYGYRDWQRSKRVEPVFFNEMDGKTGVFRDTKRASSIPNSSLPASDRGVEYSYSFWVRMDDSSYLNGKYKHIFHKGPSDISVCNPGVFIAPNGNQLMVRVDTMGLNTVYDQKKGKIFNSTSTDVFQNVSMKECKLKCNNTPDCKSFSYDKQLSGCSMNKLPIATSANQTSGFARLADDANFDSYVKISSMNPTYYDNYELDPALPCDLIDFPLQRWNHVVIVLWNRSLDVYLNGKLARSCTLQHIPRLNNSPVYLTQDGGFHGDMASFKYINRAINADEVYALYSNGYDAKNIVNNILPDININLAGVDIIGNTNVPSTVIP